MLTALRLLSILLGVLLSAAPALLALQFANGVGEAPSSGRMTGFVLPLLVLGLLHAFQIRLDMKGPAGGTPD